jgi:hypothetical protein
VTVELVRRGYTEEDIAKIWGGNLLRVMGDVEQAADTDGPGFFSRIGRGLGLGDS